MGTLQTADTTQGNLRPGGDSAALLPASVRTAATVLLELLPAGEAFLMERVLSYAEAQGYTKYTSTLVEAWRLSIAGLTGAICAGLRHFGTIPELTPGPLDPTDPLVAFGVLEAQKHRQRGIPLPMFLGLMKYYHQGYRDLVRTRTVEPSIEAECQRCLTRFFDRLELAFCDEWVQQTSSTLVEELQRSTRELANAKNEYLTIFESVLEPVFVLDPDGRVRRWNHAATFDVGGASSAPGVTTYGDEARPAWLERVAAPLARLVDTGRHAVVLETHRGPRDYEAAVQPLLDVSKKFVGRVVALHDVTDANRALHLEREKGLLELERDAQRAVAERLRAFHDELVETERMASLGQLAAGVTHELTSPLAWVRANLRELEAYAGQVGPLLARAGAADPGLASAVRGLPIAADDLEELIEDTQDGCDRIRHIVERLATFAQPEQRRPPELVDLTEVVEDALSLATGAIKRHAELRAELAQLAPVRGHAGPLGQAVLNLLINASQAFDAPGTVTVKTFAADGGACIVVADTGRGIAPEALRRVFEPFFSTRRVGEGVGLGLSHAWGVVQAHGGRLTAESAPGQGTTMRLWLPAAGEPARCAMPGDATPA